MKIRSSKVQLLCILGAVKEHIWGTFIHTYNLLASKWKFILGLSRKFIVRKISNRVFVFLPITLMVATIVITMIMVMSVYLEKRMPNNYHNYEIKIFKNLLLPVDIFSVRNINSHSFSSILLWSIPACKISSFYKQNAFCCSLTLWPSWISHTTIIYIHIWMLMFPNRKEDREYYSRVISSLMHKIMRYCLDIVMKSPNFF